MNIYLHVEISSRELDSKLLLATLAASRGHKVIVSDLAGILKGINKGVLAAGIFHTKSLTPSKDKINRHKKMVEKGFMVTSIDEEGNLNEEGYLSFAKQRYSEQTINQSSAVFGWGSEDVDTLKQVYSRHSKKIFKTGSPRADLWKDKFVEYWDIPPSITKKPYLLIASNLGYANNIKTFKELIKFESEIGRFDRDSDLLKKRINETAEDYSKIYEYIRAIKFLSVNNLGYDIILRPHPSEDIETWEIFLKDIPNVHVIRKGPINAWVHNSFAVMHNSCTTAIEATVSKKPVITYIPFEQKYASQLANKLGHRVKSLDELLKKVNNVFETRENNNQNELGNSLPDILLKKLYLDDELAAEKMVKVWEKIENNRLSNSSNFRKFEFLLMYENFKIMIKNTIKSFFPKNFNSNQRNPKFSSLNKNDIENRVNRLKIILNIKEKLECKLLSEKTILIKRK